MRQLFAREGMGGRLKRRGGQLVPLKDRINEYQFARRDIKIQQRRTVATFLIRQNAQMAMAIHHLFSRGFFGRWKWIVTGR